MKWAHLAAVAAVAGVLTTYADWLLAGDWIQKRFGTPEIWRKDGGIVSVLLSTLLPFVTGAGFAILAYELGIFGLRNCVKLGFAIWVVGPLPLIASNAIFLKPLRTVAVLQAASWLVKLLIVAVAVGKFVH
jgi:hypothetical protein